MAGRWPMPSLASLTAPTATVDESLTPSRNRQCQPPSAVRQLRMGVHWGQETAAGCEILQYTGWREINVTNNLPSNGQT